MEMAKYYPVFLNHSGYVDLADYCDLVRSKKEPLVDCMVSISNSEGHLIIVYDIDMIHYMDMAILNQSFSELNDNGNNISVMNKKGFIVHVVGNYGSSLSDSFEIVDIPNDTRHCQIWKQSYIKHTNQ